MSATTLIYPNQSLVRLQSQQVEFHKVNNKSILYRSRQSSLDIFAPPARCNGHNNCHSASDLLRLDYEHDFEYKQNKLNMSDPLPKSIRTASSEEPTAIITVLHKSHSYSGTVSGRPKLNSFHQESLNNNELERSSDCDSIHTIISTTAYGVKNIAAEASAEEQEPFLLCSSNQDLNDNLTTSETTSNRYWRRGSLRQQQGNAKNRSTICLRAKSYMSRNRYLSYLVPILLLIILVIGVYWTRDYAKHFLTWIETQNPWTIFMLFLLLFVIVSFPIVVGYFVLMITAGYLFGWIKGILTVILGANIGIAVAHVTLRGFRHRLPMQKLIKTETGRAILRVISGPKAFKVVLFTRLTPIPFGLQNAIFGFSTINARTYHIATFFGLLPAQTINVYLGSTLRSMQEVLSNHGTTWPGYVTFGVEVVCGIGLMLWVVQKARKELSSTLLTDMSNNRKITDIEV